MLLSVCVCDCVYACYCVCVCDCVYACYCLCVYVTVCMHVTVCVYVTVYACYCVCVCYCVYACYCVCVDLKLQEAVFVLLVNSSQFLADAKNMCVCGGGGAISNKVTIRICRFTKYFVFHHKLKSLTQCDFLNFSLLR